MTLSSMTGFARSHGVCGTYAWAWEIKSVNAKGLDVRLRLPVGWDAVEAPVRARAAEALSRGTVYGTLIVTRQGIAPIVRVNEGVLNAVLTTFKDLSGRIAAEPPAFGRGVVALAAEVERVRVCLPHGGYFVPSAPSAAPPFPPGAAAATARTRGG